MPKVYNKHHKDAPKDAVYVGRGTPFGNPFVIGQHGTRDEVITLYEKKVIPYLLNYIPQLKGKDLICYCAPKRCHADILLRIANEE